MKKNNIFIKHHELLTYIAQNNIKLDKKTLQLLANSERIEKRYFNLFTLSPRIINFCLKNPLTFEPAIYSFIMSLSLTYDEETVYRYLKEVLYQPENLVINAVDNRIPKKGDTDYVALMASLFTTEDIDLAYQALKHPLFRQKYYEEEIANLDSKDKRLSLASKVKIIDEASIKIAMEIREKLPSLLNEAKSMDESNLIKAFMETLIYYEDFESAKHFLKLKDITKYLPLFEVMIKVRNIDEFNIIRHFMIVLVNYINQKNNIYSGYDLEWLGMRENDIPRQINKNMEEQYKNGALHTCFMLEKINEIFVLEQEKPFVRRQINCK